VPAEAISVDTVARGTDPSPGRSHVDAPRYWPALDRAWEMALRPWTRSEGPVSVLFSGGVDSGLLAWELRGRTRVSLVTVGVPGSRELATAEAAAAEIGLPWLGCVVDSRAVIGVADRIEEDLRPPVTTARVVQLSVSVAVQATTDTEVLCGQGADELFLGYDRYRRMDPSALEVAAESDVRRLLDDAWPQSVRNATRLARTLAGPYLTPEFVAVARSIPLRDRAPNPRPKELFRLWARHRGVPDSIVDRPKRALQFGSGIDRLVRGLSTSRAPSSAPR
jgi:asparagine synthase (glutamine-hydrolysing)